MSEASGTPCARTFYAQVHATQPDEHCGDCGRPVKEHGIANRDLDIMGWLVVVVAQHGEFELYEDLLAFWKRLMRSQGREP